MAVIENQVIINRPPEVVFDALVDLRNELKWNPKVVLMELITEGPLGIGTKFRAKWKSSPVVICECKAFDRPNAWVYENGGPISVTLSVRLTPHPEGTHVATSFDATPHGWFKLIFPLFLISIKGEERRNMQYIKAWVEGK